jgi:hypothetical protein
VTIRSATPQLSKKVCMLMSLKKVWANFRISASPHRITAAFVFEDNLKVRGHVRSRHLPKDPVPA